MENGDKLLQAFHITPQDIELNRGGKLGEAQARNLRKSGWIDLIGVVVLGLGLAAILMFVVHRPLKPAQVITAGILFLVVVALGTNHFRKTHAAASEGVVQSLVGPVQVIRRGKAGFYLAVEGRTFKLPVRPWNVENNARYRVYVAPRSASVVGMEPEG